MKTTTKGADMNGIDYFRARIAEAVAARMIEGLSYEQATREAFDYCSARWPRLTAAAFGAGV